MSEDLRKINCGSCNKVTSHHVKARYDFEQIVNLREFGLNGTMKMDHEYLIVQCAGCEHISFVDIIPHESGWEVYQYPEPIEKEYQGLFLDQNELMEVPDEISDLYEEISVAYKKQAPILAGIGLRALVEGICRDQNINGRNLKEKIVELHAQGFISSQELPILDKLRTIGNVSAHEIKAMDEMTLKHAVLIVNHIIRSIYILPGFSAKINL